MSKAGIIKGLLGTLDVTRTLDNVTSALRVEEAKCAPNDQERLQALRKVEEQLSNIQVPEVLQGKPGKPVPTENVAVQVVQRNPQSAEVNVKVSPEKS